MVIPLEIWRLIAYELQAQRNRQALLSLCLTSTAMGNNVTPILYSHVELRTYYSGRLFCRTIKEFGARLGPFVQGLSIGAQYNYRKWNRLDVGTVLVESLSSALVSLPNLRELMVVVDSVEFSECFDPLATLPPFLLQKLVIPLMGTHSFYKFLISQPSIRELHVGSEHTLSEFSMTARLSRQPNFLPNLNSITAPMSVLKGAVPGRPISHVMIVTELLDWTDPGITIIAPSTWQPILCGSTVPITAIGFYQSPHSVDPWYQLIPALRQHGVDKTLKRIEIVETLEPPVTEWSRQEALTERVSQMKTLTGFDQLESIEFGEMPCATSSTANVMRWLGSMGSLVAWRKYVPSLKQVKVYGVYVPWSGAGGI
ncbi:hypothetical protein RSOLAG22IIIB_10303 [Rhizoctonia solani]|uniref:F-box domain-containing protein n=1 Tax=Rhizoctonia solani TaxID=456999 RepID=A0A0K6G3H4_9AGAM|nr:hypothetical protein RSOLAG22IIIB_10303 [Rhizoctonia solani]